MAAMLKYWLSVFREALSSSIDAIGESWVSLLYGVFVLILAALYVRYRHGPKAFREHLIRDIAQVAAVAVLAWLPFFAWHLARTPFLMHQALELRGVKTEAANQSLKDESNRKDRRIGELEGALQSRSSYPDSGTRPDSQESKKRAIRESLATFMGKGIQLRNRCRTDPPGSSLEAEAEKWFNDVQSYLRRNLDSSYAAQFVATGATFFTPSGVPESRQPLWHGLNQRIETLDKFIDQLR